MIKHLLLAPVNNYFDINPSGVILNRFSKDFKVVELGLTHNITSQTGTILGIIIHITLAAYNFIWLLIIVPIIVLSLIFCYFIYAKGMKEVRRIEAITNSPIITHLNESNHGSSTIRVYNKISQFEHKQYILQDLNGA